MTEAAASIPPGCAVADTFFKRLRGLIGRDRLAPGEALLIPKCNAIHTLFMRFAIDATFLDKRGNVVKVVRGIPPGCLFVWGGFRARQVVETAAAVPAADAAHLTAIP